MPTPYSVAFVTVPDVKAGEKIVTALLEEKLAACVNEIPNVRSSYWWQGKIERSDELLLVIKTRTELASELTACVKENHPYTVPEVVLFPIASGLSDYLNWLDGNTRRARKP